MKIPKRTNLIILIILLLTPLATLAIFQAHYTALENGICSRDDAFKEACDYPERFETYRGLNTNFYRHMGDIFGRDYGTSPSFDYLIREYAFDSRDQLIKTGNSSDAERAIDINSKYDNANMDIGRFNRSLFTAFGATVIIATVSATILVQKTYRYTKKKR